MSSQQILEKAIQKAIDGGWEHGKELQARIRGFEYYEFGDECGWQEYEDHVTQKDFIFNHDFAKALWGENFENACPWCLRDDIPSGVKTYERHLMDMVIADDPIKYLGENL